MDTTTDLEWEIVHNPSLPGSPESCDWVLTGSESTGSSTPLAPADRSRAADIATLKLELEKQLELFAQQQQIPPIPHGQARGSLPTRIDEDKVQHARASRGAAQRHSGDEAQDHKIVQESPVVHAAQLGIHRPCASLTPSEVPLLRYVIWGIALVALLSPAALLIHFVAGGPSQGGNTEVAVTMAEFEDYLARHDYHGQQGQGVSGMGSDIGSSSEPEVRHEQAQGHFSNFAGTYGSYAGSYMGSLSDLPKPSPQFGNISAQKRQNLVTATAMTAVAIAIDYGRNSKMHTTIATRQLYNMWSGEQWYTNMTILHSKGRIRVHEGAHRAWNRLRRRLLRWGAAVRYGRARRHKWQRKVTQVMPTARLKSKLRLVPYTRRLPVPMSRAPLLQRAKRATLTLHNTSYVKAISTPHAMAPWSAISCYGRRDITSVSRKLVRPGRQLVRKRWSRALTYTMSYVPPAARDLSGAVTAQMALQHSIDLLSSPRIMFTRAQHNRLMTDKSVRATLGSTTQGMNSTATNIGKCAITARRWVGKQLAKIISDPFQRLVKASQHQKPMQQLITQHKSSFSTQYPSATWSTFYESNTTAESRGRIPLCI